MTNEEVWQLLTDNEALVAREVRRFLPKHRRHEWADLWSEVVLDRLHSVMATFNENAGVKPITHLCCNLRWYAYKWAKRKRDSGGSLNENIASSVDNAATSAVYLLLNELRPEDAEILRYRYVEEFTLEELAEFYNRSISWTRRRCEEALANAQQMQGGSDV